MSWDQTLVIQLPCIVADIPPFWSFVPYFQPAWKSHRGVCSKIPSSSRVGGSSSSKTHKCSCRGLFSLKAPKEKAATLQPETLRESNSECSSRPLGAKVWAPNWFSLPDSVLFGRSCAHRSDKDANPGGCPPGLSIASGHAHSTPTKTGRTERNAQQQKSLSPLWQACPLDPACWLRFAAQ